MNENVNLDGSAKNAFKWLYCPICGTKIPQIKNIQYCIKCGVDLQYINTHMRMPSRKNIRYLDSPEAISQQNFYLSDKPLRKKLSEEELLNLEDQKLWGSNASIGITAAAYALMNFVAVLVVVIFILFTFNLENVLDFLVSPYFIIGTSFVELIFILVPALYVGKYLQNPTLNNRLILLGFTKKGFDKTKLVKEILIGLGFAVMGVALVLSVSFLMEIILSLIFGYETLQDLLGTAGEVDTMIASADILSIVLLALIMILIIGTTEEVLFRGFLQKGLVRSLGKSWGIIITALIFSSIHLIGIFLSPGSPTAFMISFLFNFFPFFAISLLLGLLFDWRKENLIAVMITHGVYNALTIVLAFIVFNFI
jgi:membrane protease YdiL (CAAX protease family)